MQKQYAECTLDEALKMLTPGNVGAVRETRRKNEGNLRLPELDSVGGLSAKVIAELGRGGTKTVYDVEIAGTRYALGLSNIVDPPVVAIEKWEYVLAEKDITRRFRELGLLVNELFDIVPARIGQHEFPAALMRRYQDCPFIVYDSKNGFRNNNPMVKVGQKVTPEQLLVFTAPTIQDISCLLSSGVMMGTSDTFNVCVVPDKTVRLFFSDLGTASFGRPFTGKFREKTAMAYAQAAINAFLNSFSFRVYNNSGLNAFDLPENIQVVEKAMAEKVLS